jgi:hypothetical protein
MKNDYEVKLSMSERRKGLSQQVAAARAGMCERTARKYEQARKLPSELKRPHAWQTRSNPFEEDWPWVVPPDQDRSGAASGGRVTLPSGQPRQAVLRVRQLLNSKGCRCFDTTVDGLSQPVISEGSRRCIELEVTGPLRHS